MPRLLTAFLVLLCLCSVFARPTLAQAPSPLLPRTFGVPTDPAPPPKAPSEPAWSGRIEFSFVSASGNSSARTMGAAGELDFHPDGWLVTTKESVVRSTSLGEVTAQSISSESRVSRRLSSHVDGYGQLDFLSNRFAGIQSQWATDGGLAWDLLSGAHGQKLELLGGFGYSYQNSLTDGNQSFATGNAGLRYTWQLSKTASISEDGLFTGSLVSAPDWRVRNTLAVSAALNKVFSLKLSHRLDFVDQPVPGFRQADQLTSAAIVASF